MTGVSSITSFSLVTVVLVRIVSSLESLSFERTEHSDEDSYCSSKVASFVNFLPYGLNIFLLKIIMIRVGET
jgi:hypothetical protein